MSARERVQRTKTVEKRDEPQETAVKRADTEELKDDLDALLDEVDGVLEENAEEFVKGYVQKGGE